MATLSSLVVNLRANTAQYQSGMSRASRTLGKFRGSVASTAGLLIGGMGLVRLGKFVINTNREFERLLAQLETVQGSAAGAALAFKNIETLAASTPFQIEQLAQAFVTLRTLGVQPTSESMTSLGNFASSMSRNITDVADAVRSAAGGMTLPLKLMGIEASIQGEKITLSYQGAAIQVQRSATAIVEGLSQISDANFAGAMAREMDTLNGIISNTQDAFGTMARTFGEVLLPFLKDILIDFRDLTSKLAENRGEVLVFATVFVGVMKVIASVVGNTFQLVGRHLGNLGALLVGIATFDFQLIKAAALDMKDNVVENVGDMVRSFGEFFTTISNLGKLKSKIRLGAGGVKNAVKDGVTVPIIKELSTLEEAGVSAGRSLIRGIIQGIDDLSDFLANIMSRVAEDLIIGTLEKELGISSPSRVAARLGRQTILGYIGGLRDAARGVPAAVGAAFALPSPALAGAGVGGGTVVHQEINFNIAALDGPSVAQVLRSQKGMIAQIVGEAAQDGAGFRRTLRGR